MEIFPCSIISSSNLSAAFWIRYTTERNRHRTAYWITIDGISFGKVAAQITADIIDSDIHISYQNVIGFTITIPSQIQRNRVCVIVNRSCRFDFIDYPYDNLHIVKDKIFRLTEVTSCKPVSRKETGILVGDLNNKSLLESVQNFAHPKYNGFNPLVYVLDISKHSGIQNTNLIVFDCNAEHFYLEQFAAYIPSRWKRIILAIRERNFMVTTVLCRTFRLPIIQRTLYYTLIAARWIC